MVPGFTLTAANQPPVVQLCRRLDGIPLALELAAVRLRAMSIEQIVARLDDRFLLLGTARSSDDRHQTLRAAIDWSHELCTAQEQRLWARLSCSPAVSTSKPPDAYVPGNRSPRAPFSIPSAGSSRNRSCCANRTGAVTGCSTRSGSTEPSTLLCSASKTTYGAWTATTTSVSRSRRAACSLGPGQVGWLVGLRQETPNLRVALDHSYTSPGQEATGLRMTVLLRHYWLSLGLFTRAGLASAALGVAPTRRGGLGHVRGGRPHLAAGGPGAGRAAAGRAADLAQERHDRDLRAHVTDAQAIASFFAGDLPTAGARHESALAEYAEIGFSDPFALVTFTRLAAVCCLTGELDRAIALSEECLRISEEMGEQWSRGTALWTRGAARWLSGDVDHAVEDTLACLRIKGRLATCIQSRWRSTCLPSAW